jgi:two-component system chemotaxis response regulator CheB
MGVLAIRMDHEPHARSPASRFDVVAIGASAGGLEALHVVLGALPVDFPAAVLIVQHMDPRHKSLLADLLGRRSKLAVRQAVDGEAVQAGMVHIARPDMHLIVRDHCLLLTDTKLVHFSRPSVDLLFESVAVEYGHRAIGVILSGSGMDGAAGIRAIKAKGGTTIVQQPHTAAHGGMPHAALATGCADLALPLDEIGPTLASLVAPRDGDTA